MIEELSLEHGKTDELFNHGNKQNYIQDWLTCLMTFLCFSRTMMIWQILNERWY